MIVRLFNASLEKEKNRVRDRLVELLEKEIKSIRSSIQHSPSDHQAQREELHRLMAGLLVRKAMAEFEAEEVIKKRTDMRASFLALVISSLSLWISIITYFSKR